MTITIRQALEKFAQLPLGPSNGRLHTIQNEWIKDARTALENQIEDKLDWVYENEAELEIEFKKDVTVNLDNGGCLKRTVKASLWRGNKLISVGVSGPRRGDECTWNGKGKDTSCRHAEQEVLDAAHGNLYGTELWITREPCNDLGCRAPLDRYGIEVHVFEDNSVS